MMHGNTLRFAVRSLAARSALAVIGAVTLGNGVALAQSVPFESNRRGTIGSGLGQTSLQAGRVFEPRIDAAAQYAANLNLAPNGQPQIDMAGLELAPGFYASYATGPVTAAIDYSLIGRVWEDSDYNDLSHRLAANGQWLAVPEWFAVRGQASYRDAVIDPAYSLNAGNLGIFAPRNLQEVATAEVSPILQHRFNEYQLTAQYRYGRVWFIDEGKGQDPVSPVRSRDSTDQSANLRFGTANDAARLSGAVFYDWQKSEYETSLVPYEFERAGVDAGVQVSSTLRLLGQAGVETDLDRRIAAGGLDSSFWSLGVRWAPNPRTSAEVGYEDRSFGDSYYFEARHQARLLEFDASYRETPTVRTQRLSLGDFNPGELPTDDLEGDLGVFNSLPYIARNGRIGVAAKGSRTTLRVSGFWYERNYLATEDRSDEEGSGVRLDAKRQLASNLSLDLSALYKDYERTRPVNEVPGADNRESQVVVRLNRDSGAKLTLGAETGYTVSNGDRDYEGWWVALRARYKP